MKQIELDEQKKIRLEIMKDIDQFCRTNDIKYFMLGGTLIGAVRHNGYIPWDDDIDIVMLRDDYERFIQIYCGNEHYKLICPENDSEYHLVMAKVFDTRTVLIENISNPKTIGVFVDIFPIDNCPGEYNEAVAFSKKADLYRKIIATKNIKISKNRHLWKNIVIAVAKIMFMFFSRRYAIKKCIEKCTEFKNLDNAKYLGELILMPYGECEIYKKEWFEGTVELKFEGNNFWAPVGYHEILTKTFGDYMQLPPATERVSHHNYSVYWKKDI